MARLLPSSSAVLLLLLPLPLLAATIHLPSQEPTIQAGLDAASAGDTVLVSCGTYHEHDLTMTSGVTLLGETGEPSCVIIDTEYLAKSIGTLSKYVEAGKIVNLKVSATTGRGPIGPQSICSWTAASLVSAKRRDRRESSGS